jgi:hypothetical protein
VELHRRVFERDVRSLPVAVLIAAWSHHAPAREVQRGTSWPADVPTLAGDPSVIVA